MIFDQIIDNPDAFENCSRDIARLLFAAMKNGKGNIKPGDLVVCLYHDNKTGLQNLALLKMEPENGYRIEKVKDNQKTRVVFTQVPNIFPTKELQKCAFIIPKNLRRKSKFDLVVLDQQTARFGSRRSVASFFQTGFLNCKTDLNSSEQTDLFITQSRDWINQHKATIPSEDIQRFVQQVNLIADLSSVDVIRFAEAVLSKEPDQEDYIDYMKERGLENLTFRPDPKVLQNWTEYIWFSGDNGLEIRVRSNAVGGKKFQIAKDGNETVVTIRTINWNLSLKRGR